MTTFTPRRIIAKASKAGKTYWEIETNMGNATCFDYPIVQEIEKSIGKPISLYDLETNEKGFINIRPAKIKPLQAQGSTQIAPSMPEPSASFIEARKAKDVGIYTSYAKDIFLELIKTPEAKDFDKATAMRYAIELVKQAKESFE